MPAPVHQTRTTRDAATLDGVSAVSSRRAVWNTRSGGSAGFTLLHLAAGLLVVGCTLTDDDFEPTLMDSATLAPAPSDPAPPPTSEPAGGAACTASIECPSGFRCADAACVPSTCPGEDVATCDVPLCADGACEMTQQCSDGLRNGAETDVDCGGPCSACPVGGGCRLGSDCDTGACVEGACVMPGCSDGVLDRDETGPDCGGATCPPCEAGVACARDADCAEGLFCGVPSGVCGAESCSDGVRSGAEAGIDCGGGCPGCAVGAACSAGSDCASGVCAGGACAAPTCSDGVRNAVEVGIDCGGDCSACPDGQACQAASDCQSAVCAALGCTGVEGSAACCQPASCTDGVRNGAESAVDCGGACARCALGSACSAGADCVSNVCALGSCRALCADGERNGDESDTDCGGSELGCARCEDGRGCAAAADCASGRCDAGVCSSCADGLRNGGELGLDCGSGEPGCPDCPRCTLDNSLDLGFVGTIVNVTADACAKITAFPSYAPTSLQCYGDGPYPVPIRWSQACTEQSGTAVCQSAYELLPVTGLSVACPIILDLGGSNAPLQMRWY